MSDTTYRPIAEPMAFFSTRIVPPCAAALALLCACGRVSDTSSNGTRCATDSACASGSCDPLATHELPVTLGTVIGIGKDSAGTIYLADEIPEKYVQRVFVSIGDSLFRKRVTGTGQTGGGPDAEYNWWFEEGFDAATSRTLLIEHRGGVVTRMALGPHDSSLFIFEPGAIEEALTVLDRSAIERMKLRNLPGSVTIEYLADVEDGNVIVVTRPADDEEYTDFRLFYGVEHRMVERKVVGVYRGNDTDIVFTVDGSRYDVHFSMGFAGDGGVDPGPGTLDTGMGTVLRVTERRPVPMSLAFFEFSCL